MYAVKYKTASILFKTNKEKKTKTQKSPNPTLWSSPPFSAVSKSDWIWKEKAQHSHYKLLLMGPSFYETSSLCCHRSVPEGPRNNKEIQPKWISKVGMCYASRCYTGSWPSQHPTQSMGTHPAQGSLEWATSFPCMLRGSHQVHPSACNELTAAAPQHTKDCWIPTSLSDNTPSIHADVKKACRYLPSARQEPVLHTHLLATWFK